MILTVRTVTKTLHGITVLAGGIGSRTTQMPIPRLPIQTVACGFLLQVTLTTLLFRAASLHQQIRSVRPHRGYCASLKMTHTCTAHSAIRSAFLFAVSDNFILLTKMEITLYHLAAPSAGDPPGCAHIPEGLLPRP